MHTLTVFVLFLPLLLMMIDETNGDKNPDEITSLPGLTVQPKFKQYSGYLDATADGDKKFHYWFVESQNNSTSDPLVLWLNGGPGCSSLEGLLSENGPFQTTTQVGGQVLTTSPYSWNKMANVLYLESPAGVGFSYSLSKNTTFGDKETAEENYHALVNFFQKYPQFLQNDFYLTGESYAGIYIPTLMVKILEGSQEFTVKGVAIGNGYYSAPINMNAVIYFAYHHGIVGHEIWEDLQEHCCPSTPMACNFYNVSGECQNNVDLALHFVQMVGLNEYAIYMDCQGEDDDSKGSTALKQFLFDLSTVTGNRTMRSPENIHYLNKMRKIPGSSPSHPLSVGKVMGPSCADNRGIIAYMNRADVREALHIPAHVQDWIVCSDAIDGNYTRDYSDMSPQFHQILKNKQQRVLIYNGDADIVCPFNSAASFVDALNLTSTGNRRQWLYEDQVAGFVEEKGPLTLMTVRGAGHMVPTWRPAQAFQMISNFLKGKPQ